MLFWEEGTYTHYPTEGVGGEGSKDSFPRITVRMHAQFKQPGGHFTVSISNLQSLY